MERTYTIPLRRQFLKSSKYQRTNKAVRTVKLFLQRHMKTEDVRLGEELNKALWARGDSHPPHKVTVVVKKDDTIAYAELAGKEFKKKNFSEEDKKEKKSKEATVEKTAEKTTPAEPTEEKSAAEIIGEAAVAKTKKEAKAKKPAAKKKKK